MKKCPLCGRQFEDEDHCPDCGIFLVDESEIGSASEESHNQTGSGKKHSYTFEHRGGKEKRSRSLGRALLRGFGIVVVIIIVLVVALFIIGRIRMHHRMVQATSYQTYDMNEDNESTDDDNITIDAYNSGTRQMTGVVDTHGLNTTLTWDDPENIQMFDEDSGSVVVEDNVTAGVIDSYSSISLDGYDGQKVTVACSIEMKNGVTTLTVNELLSDNTVSDDTAIHHYRIVVEDCTWDQAMERSDAEGGYLARINTQEEYKYIVNLLNEGNYKGVHFYLGGCRFDDSDEYYWVDNDGNKIGDSLTSDDSELKSDWYQAEPSFYDVGDDAIGEIPETVMNLFCVSGTWYLNDSSSDLAGNYPDLLTGKVGYIVEYR